MNHEYFFRHSDQLAWPSIFPYLKNRAGTQIAFPPCPIQTVKDFYNKAKPYNFYILSFRI